MVVQRFLGPCVQVRALVGQPNRFSMKKEDVLFFLAALSISIVLTCLIISGGSVKNEMTPVMIDSKIQCGRDEHCLIKKLNENEETNFCTCTSFRNNVRFV